VLEDPTHLEQALTPDESPRARRTGRSGDRLSSESTPEGNRQEMLLVGLSKAQARPHTEKVGHINFARNPLIALELTGVYILS
jgi:hypothetical protein